MGVLRLLLLDDLELTFYCGSFVVGGRVVQ